MSNFIVGMLCFFSIVSFLIAFALAYNEFEEVYRKVDAIHAWCVAEKQCEEIPGS